MHASYILSLSAQSLLKFKPLISHWADTDTAAQSAVSAADTKIFVYIPTAAPTYDVWEIIAI